jgi:hypothetical protein
VVAVMLFDNERAERRIYLRTAWGDREHCRPPIS